MTIKKFLDYAILVIVSYGLISHVLKLVNITSDFDLYKQEYSLGNAVGNEIAWLLVFVVFIFSSATSLINSEKED